MKRLLRKAAVNAARVLLAPVYSGIGSIVCLHRVIEPVPGPRMKDNVALEISPSSLEQLIVHCLERQFQIVSLSEVYDILKTERQGRKFIAFTFDDGYLDNYALAYPIFKKYNAPFAVNVTTSFVDKPERIWWYRLEEALLRTTSIHIPERKQPRKLDVASPERKEQAFSEVAGIIRSLGAIEREKFLDQFFKENGIEFQGAERLMMSWGEIKNFSADKLVTIGAHSVRHYDFNKLSESEVLFELNESRRILESQIGRKVEHFAYPFGGRNSVGQREFALAKTCGFKTIVTTRGANVFPGHSNHRECIPRIGVSGNYEALSRFKLVQSGALAARTHSFKRVVTN